MGAGSGVQKFSPGNLVLNVQKAVLEKDSDLLSNMDPFLKVEFPGLESKRTKTAQEGGTTPVWNEKLIFPITSVS